MSCKLSEILTRTAWDNSFIDLACFCAEHAVVLVVHRNQSDPQGEDATLKMPEIMSGLHLGKPDQALHMLQINVFGGSNTAELLSGSDVNRENQDQLFQHLRETLQVSGRA